MTRIHALRAALRSSLLCTAIGAVLLFSPAQAQDGSKPEARNMRLAGYSDLQARTAYQPVIQKQGERWIAYIGLVDSKMTWDVPISAIVAGHVIAVWLAHRVMLREVVTPRRAALASIPLTVLMVAYTAISLLAIAEPMVVFEAPRSE